MRVGAAISVKILRDSVARGIPTLLHELDLLGAVAVIV
jgi:hypothetical protein